MLEDYRHTLNIVGWMLAALSTLFMAARMYTRARVGSSMLGWDDWCMLVSWMFAILCTSLVTTGTTHGFGQHMWDISDPEDQAIAAMYVLVSPSFSIASAFFTKTSIIIAFMRIIGRTVTIAHKLIAIVPLVILFIVSALSCSIMIFFCSPVQKAWRPYLAGSCQDPALLDSIGKSVSAYNAAMDVFCAVVPYFLIRNINIPRKDKRNLILLMGGSIIGTFATIMKIVAMSSISNVADITHAWSEITIWYLTENHVLIIAGSFPALRPFWRVVVGKYTSYLFSDKSGPASSKTPSQKTQAGSFHLHTVGSTPRNKKKAELYSTTLVRDSSEESLNPQENRGFEGIVEGNTSHHVQVAGGTNDTRAGNDGINIVVTRAVEVV